MLIIRAAQMEALNRGLLESFVSRAAGNLQRNVPGRCAELGPEGVRRFIEQGILRAREFDIRVEYAVYEFIEMMARYRTSFDTVEWSWAREMLADASRPGDARVNRLKSYLEARENRQPKRARAAGA